jgi:hypothetical protein
MIAATSSRSTKLRIDQATTRIGDGTTLAVRGGEPPQLGGVGIDGRRAQRDPTALELVEHGAVVGELFFREGDERAHDAGRVPETRRERQRVRRSLHLAVRVIDEHRGHVGERCLDPPRIGRARETQHAQLYRDARERSPPVARGAASRKRPNQNSLEGRVRPVDSRK